MKTTLLYLSLALIFASQIAQAQISEDATLESRREATEAFIGIRYYYYPNLEAYYDTRTALYIYKQNGEWIESETIDMNSRGYSMKNSMYVMLKGYLGDNPTELIAEHKKEYPADYSSRRKPPVTVDISKKKPASTLVAIN